MVAVHIIGRFLLVSGFLCFFRFPLSFGLFCTLRVAHFKRISEAESEERETKLKILIRFPYTLRRFADFKDGILGYEYLEDHCTNYLS